MTTTLLVKIIRWVLGEVWEKINLPAVYRELKALGKKHGKRFFWAALIWELIEDGVFPLLSWFFGVPELIPLFLILHFEPIAYPAIFWGFRMYDRARGREPWDPDRSAHSSYWRSIFKVVIYMTAVAGWFTAIFIGLGLPWKVLVVYAGLMMMFGFVHERIWHDSNYGILEDDTVAWKRNLSKALTFRVVSVMILYPLFKASLGYVPWGVLFACQGLGLFLYLFLETLWSKSHWGVTPAVAPAVV